MFFYYSTLTVLPGTSIINIAQSNDTTDLLFDVQKGQAKVYSSTCGNTITGLTVNSTDTTGGQVEINVTNTTASPISIIVGVKYSASSIAGRAAPDPTTVHYRFATQLNGTTVNMNANGLDLILKP